MKLLYPAVFTPCIEKEGYVVEVPDFPGCVTEGDSLVNAVNMVVDAASGWILGELEDGNPYPAASGYSDIVALEGLFTALVALDIEVYKESVK